MEFNIGNFRTLICGNLRDDSARLKMTHTESEGEQSLQERGMAVIIGRKWHDTHTHTHTHTHTYTRTHIYTHAYTPSHTHT